MLVLLKSLVISTLWRRLIRVFKCNKTYIDYESNPEEENSTENINVKVFWFCFVRGGMRICSFALLRLGKKREFNVLFIILDIHRIL